MQNIHRRNTLLCLLVATVIYILVFFIFYLSNLPNGDRTVYTTATGSCYHRSRCSSLQYSKYTTTIEEAVSDGYRSCQNCDPPDYIPQDRDITLPFWGYIVIPPLMAGSAFMISGFILAFLPIDMNQTNFGLVFLGYIILAFFCLLALNFFL